MSTPAPPRPVGPRPPSRFPVRIVLLLMVLPLLPVPASAQSGADLVGRIVDRESGEAVQDVFVSVDGRSGAVLSDARGYFTLSDLPAGTARLILQHVAYGELREEAEIPVTGSVSFRIVISRTAIELEPVEVEVLTREERAARASGASRNLVTREQIERVIGSSRHLADVLRQTVPGVRVRESTNLVGRPICLEFRGAQQNSLIGPSCKSPMVFLDGVPVGSPTTLYGALGLETIERIRVVAPGDAGARYGTGSLYGALLIETRRPGRIVHAADRLPWIPLEDDDPRFDWEQDPEGHDGRGVFLNALAGNALGLAVGVLAADRCITSSPQDEVRSDCAPWITVGTAALALTLPAVGTSLGARRGGGTERSVGRFLPAALGTAMVLIPGYAFTLTTQGNESGAVNWIGRVTLVLGPPLVATVTDRIFRRFR